MTSSVPELNTIGILGAGRVGTAVARQAMKAGFDVTIATAKPADEIEMIVDIVTPGAKAVEEAQVAQADLVVVAVPLHKYQSLKPDLLAQKVVIDAMNYWSPVDGEINDFEDDPRTSSEIIQSYLTDSKVVKSLNHIGYHELEEDDQPQDSPNRRALAVASDHEDAKLLVTTFIDRLGYDPVDAGPLAAGRAYQPGTQIFNGSYSATQMQELLSAALRPSHT